MLNFDTSWTLLIAQFLDDTNERRRRRLLQQLTAATADRVRDHFGFHEYPGASSTSS